MRACTPSSGVERFETAAPGESAEVWRHCSHPHGLFRLSRGARGRRGAQDAQDGAGLSRLLLTCLLLQRPRARSLAAPSALNRAALPPPAWPRLLWPHTGPPSACQRLFAGCCHHPCDRGRPACHWHWQQVGLVSCGANEVLCMRAPIPREWQGVGWSCRVWCAAVRG